MNKTIIIVIVGILALVGLFMLGGMMAAPKTTTPANTTNSTAPCIVTVFGQKYDVTNFRTRHPGGDIYVCGTDMTETYKQQHGNNTDRLIKVPKAN